MGTAATTHHANALSDAMSMTARNGHRERTASRRDGLSAGKRGLAPTEEGADAFAENQGRRVPGKAAGFRLQMVGQRAVRGTREVATGGGNQVPPPSEDRAMRVQAAAK